MASVHNQIWSQYLTMVKTEKAITPHPQALPVPDKPGRNSDVQASKASHPVKGRYIDVVI